MQNIILYDPINFIVLSFNHNKNRTGRGLHGAQSGSACIATFPLRHKRKVFLPKSSQILCSSVVFVVARTDFFAPLRSAFIFALGGGLL